MNVLYISYDGALDPLGRSQVVPYLEGLSARGHRFDLLSYEKAERWKTDRAAVVARLRAAGITWRPLRYHKKFSAAATAYDLARGLALGLALQPLRHFQVLHARSYPSALVAWRLSRALGIPFIFDMRGFYAEERSEGGMWPAGGKLYRLTKNLERHFLRDASAVITLTRASVPTLRDWLRTAGSAVEPIVIPTCVDTERFSPSSGAKKHMLTYLGSIGTWYMLDEMLAFAKVFLARDPAAAVLFVTNGGSEQVKARASAANVRVAVRGVSHEDVPAALVETAATFHFIRPTFSKTASAATKFAESLALGLPVVVNAGIGDSADIVRQRRVGVVINGFDNQAYEQAATDLARLLRDSELGARCRQAALDFFSLSAGVDKLAAVYDGLRR